MCACVRVCMVFFGVGSLRSLCACVGAVVVFCMCCMMVWWRWWRVVARGDVRARVLSVCFLVACE